MADPHQPGPLTRLARSPEASIAVFGAYLLGMGALLIAVPALLVQYLDLPPVGGGFWARLSGVFCLILAYYCQRAALERERSFIRWTVIPRLIMTAFLVIAVLMGLAGPILYVFAALDLGASGWTLTALRAAGPSA